MCLLIWKPADGEIPEKFISQSWANNPHGAGLAYVKEDGAVYYMKGLMRLKELEDAMEQTKGRAAVIHLRWASVGKRTVENTHPFILGKHCGWVMAHNGTVSGLDIQGDESDTSAFARDVLSPILENNTEQIFDPSTQSLLEDRIKGSKMVLLGPHGNRVILNEKDGHWLDKVWYSNKSYEPKPVVHTTYIPSSGPAYWPPCEDIDYADEQQWQLYFEEMKRREDHRRNSELNRTNIIKFNPSTTYNGREYSGNGRWVRVYVNGKPGEWERIPDAPSILEKNKDGSYSPEKPPITYEPTWREKKKRAREIRRFQRDLDQVGRFLEIEESGNCDICGDQFQDGKPSFLDTKEHLSLCRECAIHAHNQQTNDQFQTRNEVEEFLRGSSSQTFEDDSEKGLTDGDAFAQEHAELERSEQARIMGFLPNHTC